VIKTPVYFQRGIDKFNGRPSANTYWWFHCQPTFKYDIVKSGHPKEVAIKITHVTMKVGLTIKQVLPQKYTPAIVEHEDGHALICRRFYEQAEQIAEQSAQQALGKIFVGGADDRAEALSTALDEAAKWASAVYNERTGERCTAISEQYDKLTRHGDNKKITVKDALEKAFAAAGN
jgi:hypothetical protein